MSSIVKGIAGAVAIAVGAVTGQAWLIGIGVSLEVSAFTTPKKDTAAGGTADQISYDPTEIRKLAVGYSPASQGSFLDEFSHDYLPWGGGNEGKNRVKETLLDLYDFECDSLYEVWNGTDTKLTLGDEVGDLGHPVSEYTSGGKCHLYIKFFSGAWDQAADAHLISVSGGRYTSADKGRGVCYVRVTTAAAVDAKDQVWAGGEPQLRFVVKGAKLYNPTKDSTVGGSGSHRWGDTSTYEWSDNEPLIRYNVLRGFYHSNGKKFWGGFASFDEVRFDDAVAAISIADEDVDLKAGGTQKRWRAGGEIPVSMSPRDACKSLAEASAGRTVTVAGTYRIFVGAYNTPVAAFSETDCFPQEDYEDDPKIAGDSLVNAVYGSYTERLKGWVTLSLPVRRNADDIAEDGALGERSVTIGPGFIQDFYQGQRAGEIVRRRARRQIRAMRVLHPIYYEIEPGDSLAMSDTALGYSDMAMYVDNLAVDSKINVTVNLQQDDADIYTWDKDVDELPIEGGSLPSADPPAALIPSGFDINVGTLEGDDGSSVPQLQAVWDNPGDPSATGTKFQVQKLDDGVASDIIGPDATAEISNLLASLPGETQVQVRMAFAVQPGRNWDWTGWVTVTTPPVSPATAIQDLLNQVPIIKAQADTAQLSIRRLYDQVDTQAQSLLSFSVALNKQSLTIGSTVAFAQQQLNKSIVDGLRAEASARLDLAAIVYGITTGDTDAALAARLTTAESTIADLSLNKAEADDLAILNSQINTPSVGLAAQVATLNSTVSLLDPDSAVATIQQTAAAARANGLALETVGETLLSILSQLQNNAKRIAATIAFVSTTITAQVTDGQSALARSIADTTAMLQTSDLSLSANIETVDEASVTRDTALSSRASSLEAALSGLTGSGAVQAAITAESTARASADGSLTTSVNTALSYFGAGINATNTVVASITSEANTRASADSSLSSRTSTLEAALSSYTGSGAVATAFTAVNAAVTAKSSVFVAGSAPTAIAIGDLWIDTGNGNTIKTWTGSAWLPRTDLNKVTTFAQTSTPTALAVGDIWINTTSGANTMSRWSGSAWVAMDNATIASTAASLSTLSTTVDGHTSSISTINTSLSGVLSQWGVEVNTDGAITSFVHLDGSSGSSDFVVSAANFKYYDPTLGATPAFQITGGTAFFKVPLVAGLIVADTVIADNVISHGKLVSGAGSLSYQSFGSGTKTSPTVTSSSAATYTDVASITVTGKGGTSAVVGSFTIKKLSGSFSSAYWRIKISGGVNLTDPVEFDSTPSTAYVVMSTGKEDALTDGASRTYILQVSGDNSGGSFDVYNAQLLATVSR